MNTKIPTILLVDDNVVSRKITEQVLIMAGCKVHCCESGGEAIYHINVRSYDLVFMDCMMPDMDGYETTQNIKEHANSKNVPIIALSSLNGKEHEEKCYTSGMVEIVMRPLTIDVAQRLKEKYFEQQFNPTEDAIRGL